jgi:thiol-disulfide isomerase/thioredoxin
MSRHRTLLAVVFTLLAAGLACADVKVGDDLRLGQDNIQGLPVLAGGKNPPLKDSVLLLDFWASWCAPCKASFPVMKKLHADYAARGFAIVAVSVDDTMAAAAGFWKKMDPSFMGLWDREHAFARKVGVPAMPTSYLVGRDGRVRFVHEGFHDGAERELRKQIEALLAEKISHP